MDKVSRACVVVATMLLNSSKRRISESDTCQAYALLEEKALDGFPNDFKVDLAACCTKGDQASCVSELSEAYANVHAYKENPDAKPEPEAGAEILTGMLTAIKKRIKKEELGKTYQKIYDACGDACTATSYTKIRKEGGLGEAGGEGQSGQDQDPLEGEDPADEKAKGSGDEM